MVPSGSDQAHKLWRHWISCASDLLCKSNAVPEVVRLHSLALTHALHAVVAWCQPGVNPLAARTEELSPLDEGDWDQLVRSNALSITCDVLQMFRVERGRPATKAARAASEQPALQDAAFKLFDAVIRLVHDGIIPIHLRSRQVVEL